MTEVRVEEGSLDEGALMVYRDFGTRVRMAYDPTKTTEAYAVGLLQARIPRLVGAMKIVHHANT